MAEIVPFRALRFTPAAGTPAELCCPPYDIISEPERQAYLARNAHNIIRLELPREGEDPYTHAGETLKRWQAEGLIACDDAPGYYIYEEEFDALGERKSVKGFICRVRLEEFSKGVVLPHEETLSKAKEDRFRLMDATRCNFSQIYSLYRDPAHETSSLLAKLSDGAPAVEFTDGDGVTHRLWTVTDPQVLAQISAQFKDRKLYIADGHHRYETALNFRNHLREIGEAREGDACDYVMMMLVDLENPGLVVFPTHRIVRGLAGFDAAALLDACREQFEVRDLPLAQAQAALDGAYAAGEKAVVLYAGGDTAHLLTLRSMEPLAALLPDKSKALRGLDVTVLHTLVLERVLGIDRENMANQVNLTYTRDREEALESVRTGAANCCFLMNPTRVTEISDVAAAGEKMPQKSTYFYPKLITGLVMNQFGEIR